MAQSTQTALHSVEQRQPGQLQPLPLSKSIPLFAIPAVISALAHFVGTPFFESLGYPPLTSFLAAMTIPMALLFVAALYAYHEVEGQPFTWKAFRERMRYPEFTWRDLWHSLALFAGLIAVGFIATPLSMRVINAGIAPENVPVLIDPARNPDALHAAAGGSMEGQWGIVLLFVVFHIFNIVGEELWWRGYILPRQELAHGKWTWLIHGIMWTLFHAFRWWDYLSILPTALLMSYVASRSKRNWSVAIVHFVGNATLAIFLIAGVVGAF